MFLGTGSDVGKSVLATALCRVLKQDGYRVAPFKAQNMALNSFVTPEGGEMGRAQVMQAEAAGIEPHVDMNPILLKPTSQKGSQVIVLGKPMGNMTALEYYRRKRELIPLVMAAFERLSRRFDVIVMEGAGSAVEINLKEHDLVNLSMARRTGTPCLLVGDIDRGGIFASLLGSLSLMEEDERRLIKGLIVNKFRGDPSLFEEGVKILEERSGLPVLGVVPYFDHIILPQEDSVALSRICKISDRAGNDEISLGVVRLPYISNYTDFDAFNGDPGVVVRYFNDPQEAFSFDALIIPGSKNTIHDLEFLHRTGLADAIRACWKTGRAVVGLCGGYQMLGEWVKDPYGVDGPGGEMAGLGILPVVTEMSSEKLTHQVEVVPNRDNPLWSGLVPSGVFTGYEIHMGRSVITPAGSPQNGSDDGTSRRLFRILSRSGCPVDELDGCTSTIGHAWGTYVHGIFDNPGFRRWFVSWVATLRGKKTPWADQPPEHWRAILDRQYDLLADHFRKHVKVELIYSIMGL